MTVVGQRKMVTGTLTVEGEETNGDVIVSVMDPDGNVTTPAVENPETGVYQTEFTVTTEGRWFVRFASTGAVSAAAETTVDVDHSPFA